MVKIVICPKCHQKFDAMKEPYVKPNKNRYGHAACYPLLANGIADEETQQAEEKVSQIVEDRPMLENTDEEKQKSELVLLRDYIQDLLGKDKCNWPIISKQINEYQARGMSLNSIKLTLQYCYEIKKMDKNSGHGGIGIVPFKQDEAREYFYKIFLIRQQGKDAYMNSVEKEITIKLPKQKRKIKLMDMDWEESENE